MEMAAAIWRNTSLGTNPRDPASVFLSTLTAAPAGGIQIQFTAMPGKSYSVMQCDTLTPTAWTKLQDIPAQPAQHQVNGYRLHWQQSEVLQSDHAATPVTRP